MSVWLAYYFQCVCQFMFKHVFNVTLKVVLQEFLYFFRYQQVDSGEFQIKTRHLWVYVCQVILIFKTL